MPNTFMSQSTFAALVDVRDQLVADGVGPSYIFVLWAGEQLKANGRGIYFVGIATAAEDTKAEQTFDARLRETAKFCHHPRRGGSPFWRFVDRLTRELLGSPYDQAQHRWGWSNLFKVSHSKSDDPRNWPRTLIDRQRACCVVALREELACLQNSLIVVTSLDEYGILYKTVAAESEWDKKDRKSRIYWYRDSTTGNTFVHSYHPRPMLKQGFFDEAVRDVVRLSRNTLPMF